MGGAFGAFYVAYPRAFAARMAATPSGPSIPYCGAPPCPLCATPPSTLVGVLTFLVRDGMAYLPRNFATLEAIALRLRDYRVVYFENDSVDGTTQWLRNRSHGDARIDGIHERGLSQRSSTGLCEQQQQLNCAARESLLAHFRNRILARVLATPQWDVWLALDMDFALMQPAQVWDAISMGQTQLAAAVFAVSYFVSHKTCRVLPYDVFHGTQQLSSHRAILRGADPYGVPCGARVVSGFGGIGVYFARIRRVTGLRYNEHTRAGELDHVSFNSRSAPHPAPNGP